MKIILKNIEKILLIGILLSAAFLRLYRIADYMTFLGDEGRDVLVVYNILHGHFTLLGPTSSVGGFFLGPIYYYFMAPFLFLFHYNPVGPAVMVALFGIATVWFVYKLGKEFFSMQVGLISAFLYAISPIVIAYSRSSWNPNLMPFFTMLSLYMLYKAVKKNNIWLFIFCGILLGILMQLHYLATFVGGIIFVYVLVTKIFLTLSFRAEQRAVEAHGKSPWGKSHTTDLKNSSKYRMLSNFGGIRSLHSFQSVGMTSILIKEYLLVFLGFLIGFSPFLAFEARHGFPNIMSIFKFIFQSKDVTGNGNFFGIIQDVFFRLFGRLVTDFPPPEQVSLQAHPNSLVWYVLTLILGIVSFGYFLFLFVTSGNTIASPPAEGNKRGGLRFGIHYNADKFLQYSLLFVWFVLGILLFGFYKKQIYDYYFEFMFPLPFLFVGLFLSFLWKQRIYVKFIAIFIFVALVYINIQAMPFRSEPNRQLQQMESIAKFVMDKTDNKPFNFALISGGNSDQAYRYFFTIWNHPPNQILLLNEDPERKSVTNQLFVVCESLPCHPLGYSLWEVSGFGRAEIANKWNVSVVEVYKLIPYKGK